jgi:hypothetical protein
VTSENGSGTSEKDMVGCEDQIPTEEARRWCATAMPPTASRSIAVTPAAVAAARILLPMPIHKRAARRFCIPTKNEAACVASPARIARLSGNCVHLGQNKVAQLPPLRTPLLAPDPEDPTSTTRELDELWSFVLKKELPPKNCAALIYYAAVGLLP